MMRKRTLKTSLAFALAAMLAVGVFGGCSQAEPEQEPEATPIVVAPEPEPEPEPEPPILFPLTGIEAGDENLMHLRPLAVKIENTPESRPALGITHADVVYETITEGGITRFNAIFQSDVPEKIGSVRSARNSDVTIVPEYDAIFVFSGTNDQVWAALGKTTITFMEEGSAKKALYRVSHKAAPHNLYTDTELVFPRAVEMNYPLDTNYPKFLLFGDNDTAALGDENDAIEIYVPYSGSMFNVTWKYDAASGTYLRFIQDKAQCDEEDGTKQIAADNVVALSVPYVSAPPVPNKGQTYNLDFTGTGSAIVFRDGIRIDGTWRTDGTHPPIFEDAAGNPILLKPGKTWFQIPNDIGKIAVTTGHPAIDDPEIAAADASSDAAAEEAYRAADAADVSD
ncbi:MAG: DUF3048 domain-containing protein [Clostridiales Family XIII bacterium]|jgi:hypothetical protein|nr:DUF3048 domain-containing protein [Clostridiales Family XIII bacterium]